MLAILAAILLAQAPLPSPTVPWGGPPSGVTPKAKKHNGVSGFDSSHKLTLAGGLSFASPYVACAIWEYSAATEAILLINSSSGKGMKLWVTYNTALFTSGATVTYGFGQPPNGIDLLCVGVDSLGAMNIYSTRPGFQRYPQGGSGSFVTDASSAPFYLGSAANGSMPCQKVYEFSVTTTEGTAANVDAMGKAGKARYKLIEDANTITHVTFNASGSPVDSKGLGWTTTGALTVTSSAYVWLY